MPIYDRGNSFEVCIGSGENRFRKSYKSRDEAEKALSLEEAIRKGAVKSSQSLQERMKPTSIGKGVGHSLKDAYDITVKDTWSQNKSSAHTKTAGSVLKFFGNEMPVENITSVLIREMVEEFEDDGNAGGTVNAKISALSMMLKTSAGEGWIDSIPYMKRRSAGTHRIRWMDAGEELKVLATCERLGLYSLRDFIVVAVDTGFRRMELLDFQVKEYRNGMLGLHPDETKTSKARAIPATSRVEAIIEERWNNTKLFDDLTVSKLRDQWALLRETLGLLEDTQFVVHSLRHTCASRMAMQDKTAEFIQKWMGHASPLTTARYMHLAPNKLLEGKIALDNYRENFKPRLKLA
jgi:integrase